MTNTCIITHILEHCIIDLRCPIKNIIWFKELFPITWWHKMLERMRCLGPAIISLSQVFKIIQDKGANMSLQFLSGNFTLSLSFSLSLSLSLSLTLILYPSLTHSPLQSMSKNYLSLSFFLLFFLSTLWQYFSYSFSHSLLYFLCPYVPNEDIDTNKPKKLWHFYEFNVASLRCLDVSEPTPIEFSRMLNLIIIFNSHLESEIEKDDVVERMKR